MKNVGDSMMVWAAAAALLLALGMGCTDDDGDIFGDSGDFRPPVEEPSGGDQQPGSNLPTDPQQTPQSGIPTGGGSFVPPIESGPASDAVESCLLQNQACVGDSASNAQFVCAGFRCQTRCDPEEAPMTASQSCPQGSACFALLDANGNEIPGEGGCLSSTCTGDWFNNDCEEDATCFPFDNGSSFCLPPQGTAAEGAACSDAVGCGAGLLCFQGTCERPCALDGDIAEAATCDGGESCLEVLATTPTNRVGVCGNRCGAFSSEECPAGTQCDYFVRRGGELTEWFCRDTPTNAAGLGETCGGAAGCVEGLTCVNFGSAATALPRCAPICNPASPNCPQMGASAGFCNDFANLSDVGYCTERCSPFPRQGVGNYDCEAPDATCAPRTDQEGVFPQTFEGQCFPSAGSVAPGETCSPAFSFAPCEDNGLCFEPEPGGPSTCRELCEPRASGQCSNDGFCDTLFYRSTDPILHFSFCTYEGLVRGVDRFEACPAGTEGSPCGDFAFCAEVTMNGGSPQNLCVELCYPGDDCGPGFECVQSGGDPLYFCQ